MITRTAVAAKPSVGINGKTGCRVTSTQPRPPEQWSLISGEVYLGPFFLCRLGAEREVFALLPYLYSVLNQSASGVTAFGKVPWRSMATSRRVTHVFGNFS
jgi:hypothetical protein